MIGYMWLVLLFPALSFVVISLITRKWRRLSGYISISAIALSLIVSCWALLNLIGSGGAAHETMEQMNVPWIVLGNIHIDLGILYDPLTAIMLIVVSSVSLLVQIYSQGYMHGDPGYSRYYAFLSLFTVSMLSLVLANNLLQLFISWELVGACSYLLIGFWFQKPEAAAAAKKAFIVTRFGDLGFLIGILLLFNFTQVTNFGQIEEAIRAGQVSGIFVTAIPLLLFSGAVGKSAQFPLHVWLPDAMEGPTPVSALIHAATMVAAGVYMVARLINIFEGSEQAMMTVAIVGGFTAIFAASMGLVMNDIKRVLAYSTVSQLGYMMLALGLGGYAAGVFHLTNHAFFKALLFLGAGSVIHAAGTQDIREMGGLRKAMPITFWTFTLASLSLAGIFPLSGFWSKDEILAGAWDGGHTILFAIALIAAFMTAFYMFRVIFTAFFGRSRAELAMADAAASSARGSSSQDQPKDVNVLALATAGSSATMSIPSGGHSSAGHGTSGQGTSHGSAGVHESPWVMTIPLIVLAIPSVLSGPIFRDSFAPFLGEHAAEMDLGIALTSSLVALAGILLAYLMYGSKVISAERVGAAFGPLYTLVSRKYYVDEFYQCMVDVYVIALSKGGALFDKYVVDGVVNGVASILSLIGAGLRRVQTGQVQFYGLGFFVGVFLIMAILLATGQ